MSSGEVATSIVATVGPATRSADQLTAAIRAGARGFRIPLSRQAHAAVDLSSLCRTVAADLGADVSVYLDVPGPKKILVVPPEGVVGPSVDIRVPIVKTGESPDPGVAGRYLLCDTPSGYFEVGDTVLLGDGEVALSVVGHGADWLMLRTPERGLPAGQFGVAVSGKEGHVVGSPLLSSRMIEIIRQIPYAQVMLSFVESHEQMRQLQETLIGPVAGPYARRELWAKVETRRGVRNLEGIAQLADGVLLGRGDLLIDTGYEEYYWYEQQARELLLGGPTPLMIGTQLWTASSASWLPHRSELSCLCQWISGGVHSILLSDETTIGADPARAISMIYTLTKRYSAR